jgi:glycosyltransferase involved in cell wall biosynthesis
MTKTLMKTESVDRKYTAWITWEVQVRNRSMARILDVPLYELTSNKPRLIRYPVLLLRTLSIVFRKKIQILFIQNPSIVLSFLAILLKGLINIKVVVDAHNSGIYPLEGKSRMLNFFARLICKKADNVIVTNSHLAKVVRDWGGIPFIMPDPLPDFSNHSAQPFTSPRPYLLFICTWASDEPYLEIIAAAQQLEVNIDIYITGNFNKKLSRDQTQSISKNVRLLGFVSEEDYLSYFKGAVAVIDLTTRDNCLVCGGYEAVALEKPGILSDTNVNKEVFGKGFILTKNDSASIKESIYLMLENKALLKTDVLLLKKEHLLMNSQQSAVLKTSLSLH